MRKLLSIFLFLLIAALLLFVVFFPTIISSSWGKQQLVYVVNHQIPGKISIEKLSVHWFGSQQFEGIVLSDLDGKAVLSMGSATADGSLLSLIWNPSTGAKVTLNNFNATLISDSEGNTNLMRALDPHCCAPQNKEKITPVTVVLKNVNGELNLASNSTPMTIKISGQTEQENLNGKFKIDATLSGVKTNELKELDLAKSLRSNPNVDLKIDADVSNFPVAILDQLLSLKHPEYAGVIRSLLGEQLSLTVNQKSIPEGISLALNARSPTLSANVNIDVTQQIVLSKPGSISFKMTPQLVEELSQALNIKNRWNLSSPTAAILTINKFAAPLDSSNIDQMDLAAVLEIAQADFSNESKSGNLSLKSMRGTITAEPGFPTATITLVAQGIHNQQPMNVNIRLNAAKKLLWENLKTLSLKGIAMEGQISGVPLSLIDQELEMNGVMIETFGSKMDLTLSLKEVNERPLAILQCKSDRLELPSLALWIDQKITLQQPATATIKLPPSVTNLALKETTPRIQNPVTAQLTIHSFSIPRSSLKNFASAPMTSMYKVALDAELKISPVQLISLPAVNSANLSDISIHLLTSTHSHSQLSASATLFPDGAGRLYDLIGKQATVNADASFGITLDGKPTINVFNVRFVSDLGRMEMSGEMRDGNRIILNNPAFLSYTFSPAGLQTLGIAANNYVITQKSPIEISIDSSLIPLDTGDLSMLRLSGTVKIDDLEVATRGRRDLPHAIVDNLRAKWNIDAEEQTISCDFTGITRLGENEGAGGLRGSLVVDKWIRDGRPDFNETTLRLKAKANNLPTQLISSLSGGQDLVSIIGNAIDIDTVVSASADPASEGTVELTLNSDNLTGKAILLLGDIIRLKEGHKAEFHLKLTPQSYEAIRHQMTQGISNDFSLIETANVALQLKALNIPTDESMLQSGIEGDFTLDQLVGIDGRTKNRLSLNGINGHIAARNIADHVDFSMTARGEAAQGVYMGLNLTGAMDQGFSPDGTLNKQNLSLYLDGSIDSMPIAALCQFACVDPKTRNKLEALIGPLLNAKIKAKLQRMNGPLFIALQGNHGSLTFDASLNKGYLFLNQDIVAQVAVTPQLSKYVFEELIPVIGGMISADHPLKLTIDKQGFSIPIDDFSEKSAAIQRATLDLGKVRFSGASQIAKVLSLLTTSGGDQFMVWLTPAYFSLNQGALKLERVDMLISESYPIAAWGNVDFEKERVNMIIALSGAAIDKAFGFANIPANTFLQIPLKGKLDNPSIDKTKAAARLSALVAQSQGGPQGTVIGTVLDIASGGLSEGAPPKPTTNPLPWAALMQDKQHDNSKAKKSNPIDDVSKGATTLLKQILR